MLVPVIVEVIAGLIVVWVAIRAWEGRLSRNGAVEGADTVHDAQRRGL